MERKTVTIKSQAFDVRPAVLATVKTIASEKPANIQVALVAFFTEVPEAYVDEYRLLIFVGWPESSAVRKNSRTRATADARKFTKGELSGQEGRPDTPARILDAGQGRSTSFDSAHAEQVLADL